MPLQAILKLIGLQPIPAKMPKEKPIAKAKTQSKGKPKRRERQTEEWESIGSTVSYGMTETEDLDQVPKWLLREWKEVRGTTRTLGGKWRIRDNVVNPEEDGLGEGYGNTGYFRNGKKYRYMIVAWEGMMGSDGEEFYRKRKR